MNEVKRKSKRIKITSSDIYEEKPILDYLISLMDETKNRINSIHQETSEKIINNEDEKIIKENEQKINEDFNKVFNVNNKKDINLFESINDINNNHIKKYKTILKFLNLNLSIEKNIEKKEEVSQQIKYEDSNTNLTDSKIESIETSILNNKENKIDKEIEKKLENKNDNKNIEEDRNYRKENLIRNNLEEKDKKYNNIFEFVSNSKEENEDNN